MSGSVPFHPLEKQRKSEGTGEETDLQGDVEGATLAICKNNVNDNI